MDLLGNSVDGVVGNNMTLSGTCLNLDGNSNDAFPPLTFLADATAWVELEDQFRNSEPVSTACTSSFANTWTFTHSETSDMLVNSGNTPVQPECSVTFPLSTDPESSNSECLPIVDPLLKGDHMELGRISSTEADKMEVARIMEQLKKGWDGTSPSTITAQDNRSELEKLCKVEDCGSISINLIPLFSAHMREIVAEKQPKDKTTCTIQLQFTFGVLRIAMPLEQLWNNNYDGNNKKNNNNNTNGEEFDEVVNNANGVKRYVCKVCEKDYASRAAIRIHLRSHTNTRPYECPHCDNKFKQAGHLRTHLLTHNPTQKPFKCSKCSAAFNQRHHLVRHESTCFRLPKPNNNLPPPRKQAKSAQNEAVATTSKESEQIDIKTIKKSKVNKDVVKRSGKQECPDCGKSVHKLKRHMRLVHTEARPCICSECGAEFKTMQHWKQHMVIHSDLMPYGCNVCGHRFKLAALLTRHMLCVHRPHTPKPFPCDACDKSFTRKDSLADHKLVHSSTRVAACDQCSLKFSNERRLTFHKANMHPADDSIFLVKCPKCDMQFTRVANLRRHAKTACKAD